MGARSHRASCNNRSGSLLEKMRGLSQGFGSYCGEFGKLDQLMDELRIAAQGAFIER
jgi:hypothetical protein